MKYQLPAVVRQWRAVDPRNRQARHEGHRILTRWRWSRGQWQELWWGAGHWDAGNVSASPGCIQSLIESHLLTDLQESVAARQHQLNEARKALDKAERAVQEAKAAIATTIAT